MAKLSSPKIVISIPRLAAYFVAGCFILYAVEVSPQPTNNQPLQSVPTSSHQTMLVTPPPAVPLPAAPTTAAGTTVTTKTTAAPHSTQPAPVVTPAPSANVSGLTPVNPTPTPPTNTSSSTTPSQPTTSSYTSLNWAGYMATAGSYTGISGSWTVPTATSAGHGSSYDATWIGIGGVTTDDLIQVGTDNTVSGSGHEVSTAFYELLPQASHPITALTLTPGDHVSASLSEISTGEWKISITDTTTGKSYTTTVSYASAYSSAEWIEEDPSTVGNRLLPLDSFTPVSFTNSTTTSKGADLTLATSNAQPVTMVTDISGKQVTVAAPSVLGADKQSFSVTENTGL